jgi:hypothetical protein
MKKENYVNLLLLLSEELINMKESFTRMLAFVVIVVPIALAVIGIKLLRDTVFLIHSFGIPNLPLQLLIGLVSLGVGFYLVGSFVLFRDRKRNKVQGRFLKR